MFLRNFRLSIRTRASSRFLSEGGPKKSTRHKVGMQHIAEAQGMDDDCVHRPEFKTDRDRLG
jgi:hypothetical protein